MPSSDISNYSVTENPRDGRQVTIRATRYDDKGRITDAFRKVSAESLYRRTFSAKRTLSATDLKQLVEVDFDDAVALVAVMKEWDQNRIVGGGRYIRTGTSGAALNAEEEEDRESPAQQNQDRQHHRTGFEATDGDE
jgi:hypothetical protein